MKIQLIFKWFDFWLGLFWDEKKNWLYILPVPMFGIIFKFKTPFKKWMKEITEIAYREMPQHYKNGDKWHEVYFKMEFYDNGYTPRQAWDEYTRHVN